VRALPAAVHNILLMTGDSAVMIRCLCLQPLCGAAYACRLSGQCVERTPAAPRRLDAPWGTEDNPVEVTSSYAERIVGVPDPYDDSIVWCAARAAGERHLSLGLQTAAALQPQPPLMRLIGCVTRDAAFASRVLCCVPSCEARGCLVRRRPGACAPLPACRRRSPA